MNEDIGKILQDPQRMSAISEAVKSLFDEVPESENTRNDAPASSGDVVQHSKEDKNDPKIALLCAIKPFMGETRKNRIDKIMKIMSLADLYGTFKNLL